MRISGLLYGRRPRVIRPAVSPAYSNGMTVSPSSATNQRSGREKVTPLAFPAARDAGSQRMDLSNLMPATKPGRDSASTSPAGRPACFTSAKTYLPPSNSRTCRSLGVRPLLLAKPMAAGVGTPSGPKERSADGPLNRSSRSGWRAASASTTTASRRGVPETYRLACPRCSSSSNNLGTETFN